VKRRRADRGRAAWLVTWDSVGDHGWPALSVTQAERNHRVVAIMPPQWGVTRVAEIVTLLYARAAYTLSEQVHFCTKWSDNPYQARISRDGRITCGHNPYLFARVVSRLRPTTDHPESPLVWDERPLPKVPDWLIEAERANRQPG
jgi:hypothetical protein